MKKLHAIYALLMLILHSCAMEPAYAASPVIWNGSRSKVLTTKGFQLSDGTTIDNDGPLNLIKQGTGESADLSGWVAYDEGTSATPTGSSVDSPAVAGTPTRTTSASEVLSGTGSIKLSKSGADGKGEGWYYAFTTNTNDSLNNALNELSFTYRMSAAPAADTFRVYIRDITNGVNITPQFTSCGGGSTPALTSTTTTCNAKLAWLATTGTSYRLYIHIASTDTTAVDLVVDKVFVGQRGVQVGPGQSGEVSYTLTPKGSTSDPTLGTNSSEATWSRQGEYMQLRVNIYQTGAGSAGSGQYYFPLPSGYTIYQWNAVQNNANGLGSFGQAEMYVGTSTYWGNVQAYSSTALTVFVGNETTAMQPPGSGFLPISTAAWRLSFTARVRINEWAGGVAYGENSYNYYCSEGNTWGTTNSSAATTTGCVSGVLGGTTTPAGTAFNYVFTPSTPVPVGTRPVLEISTNRTNWFAPGAPWAGSGVVESLRNDGTNYIGAGVAFSGTNLIVTFGKYAYGTSGAWNGTWYWRVYVPSPGQAVGFGLAPSDGSTIGLFQANAQPYVRAYVTGPTCTSSGVTTTFTETADTANAFASNTFTAPSAGRYQINYRWNIGGIASGTPLAVYGGVKVNGSTVENRVPAIKHGTSALAANDVASVSILLNLAANDAVTFSCITDTGSVNFDGDTYSVLTIAKIP